MGENDNVKINFSAIRMNDFCPRHKFIDDVVDTRQKNKKQKQAVGIGVQFVNRYQYVWLELWIDSKLCFVFNLQELM